VRRPPPAVQHDSVDVYLPLGAVNVHDFRLPASHRRPPAEQTTPGH